MFDISGKCKKHNLTNCPSCTETPADKIIKKVELKFDKMKLKKIKKPKKDDT